jgi:phosphosulfolactate synthase (CoM biosynthesis protein A)
VTSWRTNVLAHFINGVALNSIMLEAADPAAFG